MEAYKSLNCGALWVILHEPWKPEVYWTDRLRSNPSELKLSMRAALDFEHLPPIGWL